VYVLIVFVIANGDKSAMMNSRETSRLKPAYTDGLQICLENDGKMKWVSYMWCCINQFTRKTLKWRVTYSWACRS